MRQYAIRRLMLFVPTLILATMLVFALFWVVPGDAAYLILGGGDDEDGAAVSVEQLEALRHELGLDRPIYTQYGLWLWDVVRGDLGTSIWYKTPILDELKTRFVVTMELAVLTLFLAVLVAIPLGVISAVRQDTPTDYGSRVFTLLGIAMPNFWLGVLTIYGLAYFFNWLPPLRYADVWENPTANLQQMVFPALVLATHDLAFLGRVTRSSMLEVLPGGLREDRPVQGTQGDYGARAPRPEERHLACGYNLRVPIRPPAGRHHHSGNHFRDAGNGRPAG